jgi:hypothetical protein
LVYQELRALAARKMAQELPGQTLQPTALVHEAWLRLVGSENPSFQNRAHLFGVGSNAAELRRLPGFIRCYHCIGVRSGGKTGKQQPVKKIKAVARSFGKLFTRFHAKRRLVTR